MSNKFVPVPRKNMSPVKSNLPKLPNIPTFNLSELNVLQLSNNLKSLLNESPLTNNLFAFTARSYNKKLELERDRVRIVNNILTEAISINKNILQYSVDAFLTQQKLEYYITKFQIDVEIEARALARAEELMAKQHIDSLDVIDDGKKLRKEQLKKLELENAMLQSQTDEARTKVDFIKSILSQVNVKDMPPTLQAYITTSIINPNGTQFNDFDMQQQIKEFVIRKEAADTIEKESKAKVAKKTAEKTVSDIDSIRNSPET